MGIFSKVHFQPRILPRSSWWITLMLLLACTSTHGKVCYSYEEFEQALATEYPGSRNKEKWIKNKMKPLIDYKVLYIEPYQDTDGDQAKRDYVKNVYNKFEMRGRCTTAQIKQWMDDYDNPPFWKRRLDIFKQTLKKLLSYQEIINEWNNKNTDTEKINYLKDTFKNLYETGDTNCYIIDEMVEDSVEKRKKWEKIKSEIDAKKEEEAERKRIAQKAREDRNRGVKDAETALSAGLSPDLFSGKAREKVQLMNALYDRFKHMTGIFWHIVDPKKERDQSGWKIEKAEPLLVELNHSQCEISGKHLSDFNLYAKFVKGRNCKICGRLLCDAYATSQMLKGVGKKGRVCADGKGCNEKITFRDLYAIPSEAKTLFKGNEAYKDGYYDAYVLGLAKRDQCYTFRMKCILYKRFHEVAKQKFDADSGEYMYNFRGGGAIRDLRLKAHKWSDKLIKHNECEVCKEQMKQSSSWLYENCIPSRWKRATHCKACGRMLCEKCRKTGVKDCYCKEGKGCQGHVPTLEPVSFESDSVTPTDSELELEDSNTIHRKLGKINLSDSFWQGFFTSMLIILGTFVVYHLMFQEPSKSSCRKTYIKKKRSTFFKGRTSDVKSRASGREAKGVFSKVIRRQLSKLDEN